MKSKFREECCFFELYIFVQESITRRDTSGGLNRGNSAISVEPKLPYYVAQVFPIWKPSDRAGLTSPTLCASSCFFKTELLRASPDTVYLQ